MARGIIADRMIPEDIGCFGIRRMRNGRIYCDAVGDDWFAKYYKTGVCGTNGCPFFKTKADHINDMRKANKILVKKGYALRVLL